MKTCPFCEGRKVAAKLVPTGTGYSSRQNPGPILVDDFCRMLGTNTPIRVIGAIEDTPCGQCRGTGRVTVEKFERLTGGRK